MSDYWDGLDKREPEPGEQPAGFTESPANAAFMGVAFLGALSRGDYEDASMCVTPESRPAWGDFVAARTALEALGNWGVGTVATRAVDAADVAYVKVLPEVTDTFVVSSDQIVSAAMIVSLVWRPELGAWLVHAIGDDYEPPHDLPRSSPGSAPADV